MCSASVFPPRSGCTCPRATSPDPQELRLPPARVVPGRQARTPGADGACAPRMASCIRVSSFEAGGGRWGCRVGICPPLRLRSDLATQHRNSAPPLLTCKYPRHNLDRPPTPEFRSQRLYNNNIRAQSAAGDPPVPPIPEAPLRIAMHCTRAAAAPHAPMQTPAADYLPHRHT